MKEWVVTLCPLDKNIMKMIQQRFYGISLKLPTSTELVRIKDDVSAVHFQDALQASTKKRNLKQKEKQLNTDQCMAASIGDVEWLDQSLKNGHDPNGMDKNVSIFHLYQNSFCQWL